MRPPIVTIVSRARWEADLLAHARATAAARVLGRCAHPAEVDRYLAARPVIVCGGETPWLSPALVERWRRSEATVAVVADPTDRGGRMRLRDLGCDLVLSAQDPPARILAHLSSRHRGNGGRGRVVTVTGPRGAPGRSEVALALAWGASDSLRVLLAEMDPDAPFLGPRLGLPPKAATGDTLGRRVGKLEVLTGSLPRSPFSLPVVSRLIELGRLEFDLVICDVGPAGRLDFPTTPDAEIIVSEATPVGAIRAARLVADWTGDVPLLVLNRVPAEGSDDAVRAIRAATGLDPAAVLPLDPEVAWGRPPSQEMVELLRPLTDLIGGPAEDRLPGPAQRTAR